MPETIYEMSKRMCNGTNCEGCPLHKAANTVCLIGLIKDYEIKKVAEQLAVLREWVQEHPQKTYKDVFLEKFPKATILDGNTTLICKNNVFGASYDCLRMSSCEKCWNEPYKE
jgi:hypothetical protein